MHTTHVTVCLFNTRECGLLVYQYSMQNSLGWYRSSSKPMRKCCRSTAAQLFSTHEAHGPCNTARPAHTTMSAQKKRLRSGKAAHASLTGTLPEAGYAVTSAKENGTPHTAGLFQQAGGTVTSAIPIAVVHGKTGLWVLSQHDWHGRLSLS